MDLIERYPVLGVDVAATTLETATRQIEGWINDKAKVYVCIAPVSTIVDCQRDERYRNIVNNAAMVTPDGMPLVWLGKIKGYSVGRTYGPDLLPFVCKSGLTKGCRHFFYGGTEESINRFKKYIQKDFPELRVAGCIAPPFQKVGAKESTEMIDRINNAQPDILWVGLGSPKQDIWMANHRDKLDAPVLVGVGAAFDFIAGVKPQAPKWMQRCGLEWLFRLCCEPRRLWRRYLVGNTLFVWLLIKNKLKKLFS